MASDANPDVDDYVAEAELWPDEIEALRPVLRGRGLDEEIKWAKPCYTHDGANIAILQEMKDFLSLMFFKGALLEDPAGVLESQGANTRSARRICFRSVDDVTRLADTVADYVENAIDVEEAGLEVPSPPEEDLAPELVARLDADPTLKTAFEDLTPGRRRAHNLVISGAKKSETRASRVEKAIPKILAGKGPQDR